MTIDLRQAILALTNVTRALMRGEQVATDERVIDSVLGLMPAGPILETLWAALPTPVAVMSFREGPDRWSVQGWWPTQEQAERVQAILSKPLDDHTSDLALWAKVEETKSTAAQRERERALEKRLLAEREAFSPSALDNPLRQAMRRELLDMAGSSFSTEGEQEASVEKAMARLAEASTKPLHGAPAGEAGYGDQ
jgi:hypothetical protein